MTIKVTRPQIDLREEVNKALTAQTLENQDATVKSLVSKGGLSAGGTATADQYLLDAIEQMKAESAFDVLVYDTRKDSDGGAWRKRTQHTSWYNETLYFYMGGDSSTTLTGDAIKAGSWQHFACVRKGTLIELYIDGQLIRTDTSAEVRDVSHPDNHTRIGAYIGTTGTVTYPWLGELALLKVSATAITASQVAKIFNDEKLMFEINAKATLYWDATSSNKERISGLAYDPITKRIHAGTSSGRSEFQGLIRVNNSTDAVGTNITSVDGMVAEG